MKVAIYARYSSDNQRDASIADQVRVCRAFAERQNSTIAQDSDHAMSGATLLQTTDICWRQHRHSAEGDITHLHIGFKGTMNALYLKDLAEKTHRGLRGRIEDGKSAGGLCDGYRVVRRSTVAA